MRHFLLLCAFLALTVLLQLPTVNLPAVPPAPVAQQPEPLQPDPPRHDQYRDDPHAYCFHGKPETAMPGNPSAHPCECKQSCIVTADGAVVTVEDPTCGLYCTKSRCLCNVDEQTCPAPEVK